MVQMPETEECVWCGRLTFRHRLYLVRVGRNYERICGVCYDDYREDTGEAEIEDTPSLEGFPRGSDY